MNIICSHPQTLLPPLLLLLQRLPPLHYHLVQLVHALVQTLSYDGAGRLDVIRGGRAQLGQSQLPLDLPDIQRPRQVLLVGDDQQRGPLVLGEAGDLVQLGAGLLQPLRVHRVHHVHDAVRAPAVGLPQRPQLLLAPDVPEVAADAPGGPRAAQTDPLRVEADGGHRVDELVEFQPVQDGGFPRRVQTEHDDVQGREGGQVGEAVPHDAAGRRVSAHRGRRSHVPGVIHAVESNVWSAQQRRRAQPLVARRHSGSIPGLTPTAAAEPARAQRNISKCANYALPSVTSCLHVATHNTKWWCVTRGPAS